MGFGKFSSVRYGTKWYGRPLKVCANRIFFFARALLAGSRFSLLAPFLGGLAIWVFTLSSLSDSFG